MGNHGQMARVSRIEEEPQPIWGKTQAYEGVVTRGDESVDSGSLSGGNVVNNEHQRIYIRLNNKVTGQKQFGPCRWTPRPQDDTPGILYPKRGDTVLVVFSDDREPWIVEWWPKTYG